MWQAEKSVHFPFHATIALRCSAFGLCNCLPGLRAADGALARAYCCLRHSVAFAPNGAMLMPE